MLRWVSASLMLALATTATAQAPPPAPDTGAAPVQAATYPFVTLEIGEPISTRTQARGDTFAIRLAEPVRLPDGATVPAGVTGQGQVVDAGRAGMGGKPAKLVLAARYLDWDGRRLPLHDLKWSATGTDRQGAASAARLVPYAGIVTGVFIHGGEIDVPAGTRAQARLVGGEASTTAATASGSIGPPPPGKAQVVFFRPARLGVFSFSVHEGDVGIGKLGGGSYFVHAAEPGSHTFTIQAEATDSLTLEVEAGETYYVKETVASGVLLSRPRLTPADRAEFEKAKLKASTQMATDLKPKT